MTVLLDSIEIVDLFIGILTGITVGGFYFGGLWWTIRRMPNTNAPFSMYFGILMVRLLILLATFLGLLKFVGALALITALAGFIIARIVLISIETRTCFDKRGGEHNERAEVV